MRELKKDLWPHKIKIPYLLNPDIEVWLGQNMGPFKCRWNVVHNYDGVDFYFKDSKDAVIFSLMWT